jgi:hypothetical protein
MLKRPKQLRMDGEHVLLLTVLRNYLGATYDSDVGAAAVRCLAEQVAATYAKRGEAQPLAALLPIMNEAAKLAYGWGPETPDLYQYDRAGGQILRRAGEAHEAIPVAFPLA